VAERYFRLNKASTYQYRSKASMKLYIFSGSTSVRVEDPRDQARFAGDTKMFSEVDGKGNLLVSGTASAIPLAFTRKGMVPPKSYQKLQKAPSAKPVAPAPAPAAPAVRTVASSKTEEPAKAEVASSAKEVANNVPAAAKVDAEKTAAAKAEKPDSASKDSAPKKRKKRSRKKKAKKESGSGDDK
jgi:hypothetical protein